MGSMFLKEGRLCACGLQMLSIKHLCFAVPVPYSMRVCMPVQCLCRLLSSVMEVSAHCHGVQGCTSAWTAFQSYLRSVQKHRAAGMMYHMYRIDQASTQGRHLLRKLRSMIVISCVKLLELCKTMSGVR
jgi:hypothetical protein